MSNTFWFVATSDTADRKEGFTYTTCEQAVNKQKQNGNQYIIYKVRTRNNWPVSIEDDESKTLNSDEYKFDLVKFSFFLLVIEERAGSVTGFAYEDIKDAYQNLAKGEHKIYVLESTRMPTYFNSQLQFQLTNYEVKNTMYLRSTPVPHYDNDVVSDDKLSLLGRHVAQDEDSAVDTRTGENQLTRVPHYDNDEVDGTESKNTLTSTADDSSWTNPSNFFPVRKGSFGEANPYDLQEVQQVQQISDSSQTEVTLIRSRNNSF